MLDPLTIKKYDPSGMHKIYDMWPQIAKKSYQSTKDAADFENINHVVFSGMGGSGTIADIFSSILSKSNLHTCVVKGYHLPRTVDANTLVVTTSVSGNTVETLEVLKSAHDINCRIIAFSSGGKMQQYCTKNNLVYKKIEYFHSPRASLAAFLYSMLAFLGPLFNIKSQDIAESIKLLENLKKQIGSSNLDYNNPSLKLAAWISGIPIIYYPWGLQAAATRFKNSLQENVKIHAMAEDIMEASHNGIVSWETPSNVQPILIRGEDDYIKTKERWNILKEYFHVKNIEYEEVVSVKGSILSKLINLIYMLDYSTIYRSFLSGRDPSPIASIDYIKKKMN
ncbi:MAG TPA: SIS domain-containing protein [Nitrosopumilaceae archaeon]|nr:SIS domain-containing protein [Nitrosopumilaceae archaeon]